MEDFLFRLGCGLLAGFLPALCTFLYVIRRERSSTELPGETSESSHSPNKVAH
jgi:hypothetical protein